MMIPDGQTKQVMKQFSLFFGVIVIVGGILQILSYKRLWLVELVGPISQLCSYLAVLSINSTNIIGEVTDQVRQ